ncbi:hypothetical protein GCM10010218_35780 [Streptomyces mashuensis]|uniref:arginine--tRNA ligase n=1 Tax=Streptomyces mashuensis TaxID=33904 RepID=A0A919EDU2_9ACTN|nr:arginine--tRNA ligase [Streptomyces mashuensis]GHF51077.1 hypothetical protein GCM10010218_35780 [Streptomyces mashuensis]
MTPADLSRTVLEAVRRAVEDDELAAVVPARVSVRVPPRPGCGDYATNVALSLAKDGPQPALAIAEVLRRRLLAEPGIERVDVAGPGFLNIHLAGSPAARVVAEALATPVPSGPVFELRPDPDLVARLGADAARWSLLCPPGLDRDLLLVQREVNPLFLVRYAHARCRALVRNGGEVGVLPVVGETGDENPLTALLADHPRLVAARSAPRLARHLERVADAFLRWQAGCAVLPRGDEKPSAVHRARLALAEATGTVLADGLTQLGITAPAHL